MVCQCGKCCLKKRQASEGEHIMDVRVKFCESRHFLDGLVHALKRGMMSAMVMVQTPYTHRYFPSLHVH